MIKPSLPDTLHETLTLAVNDARKLDRRLYRPDFFYWHSPWNDVCLVCLAGCIIAGSLSFNRHQEMLPSSIDHTTDNKLQAVNCCRIGDWSHAFDVFHNHKPSIELMARLECLDAPEMFEFKGWEQFDAHLESLEAIIPALREIENQALSALR